MVEATLREVLKTSEEWQKIFSSTRVIDPDGWDRGNFRYSWYKELITEGEYLRRAMRSTCGPRDAVVELPATMYSRLVSVKKWADAADEKVFWFGFFVAILLAAAFHVLLIW